MKKKHWSNFSHPGTFSIVVLTKWLKLHFKSILRKNVENPKMSL